MIRNLILGLMGLLVALVSCQPKTAKTTTSGNQQIENRVEALLAKMTLDEKIGQMNQYTFHWEMTGPAPENVDSMLIYNMIKNGEMGSMLNVTGANATRKVQQWAVDSSRLGIPLILGYDVIHGYKTMFPIPFIKK